MKKLVDMGALLISVTSLITLIICVSLFSKLLNNFEQILVINYKAGLEMGCFYNNTHNIDQCREVVDRETFRFKEIVK